MNGSYRYTVTMLLICALLPLVRHAPEAGATEARPAQRTLSAAKAKTSRADAPRVRSSRNTPSRRTSKQGRRSARRSLSRMQEARRIALQPKVLDPSRIHTIDGASFQYGRERFRVHGIDETQLADEWAAHQRLDGLLHQGHVTVVPMETDHFGWTIAEVLVNNRSVSTLFSNP